MNILIYASKKLMIILLMYLNIKKSSSSNGLQRNYWNTYFNNIQKINNSKELKIETDIFQCYTFIKDEKTKRISWKCVTKIPNIIWIPNKSLFDKKKIIFSITDNLGTLYTIPYSIKKLLNICTSNNIEILGESNKYGVIILPKNFTFLNIHDCMNIN